jgi:hypothetical protein
MNFFDSKRIRQFAQQINFSREDISKGLASSTQLRLHDDFYNMQMYVRRLP